MKINVSSNALKILNALRGFSQDVEKDINISLQKNAMRANNIAVDLLTNHADATGEFPVPVKSGFLRRQQTFLGPFEAKNVPNHGTVRTGKGEIALINGAEYALTVHDGTGSHSKYGPRPFAQEALEAILPVVEKDIKAIYEKNGKSRGF